MKEEGKHYCDVSRVSVAPIAKSIAKDIIIKKHYTHAWTACRYALGIYHTMDERDIFGNDQELVGEYDLLSSKEVKKVNFISRLIKSINYLIWGDV